MERGDAAYIYRKVEKSKKCDLGIWTRGGFIASEVRYLEGEMIPCDYVHGPCAHPRYEEWAATF